MKKKLFFFAFAGIGILIMSGITLNDAGDSIGLVYSYFFMFLYFVCLGIFTYHYIKLDNIQFGEKEVIRHGGERFSYSEIKGIAIYRAANGRGIGPKDKNGNSKALVSLYSSPTSFLPNVWSDGKGCLPIREGYCLGRIILDKEVLLTLFNKTKLPVFITEQVMKLYYESYADIFEKYQFRVLIGCAQETDDGEREFISLAEFKKYHNM